MICTLQLVRHGKTEAVPKKIYCGVTDLPLSEEGIREIRAFVEEGLYRPAEAHFSSGLRRAVQTLALIAGEVSWEELADLRECNFGEFEQRRHEELLENEAYQKWISDETGTFSCPGGESTVAFNQRVDRGWDALFSRVRALGVSSALVTAHGGSLAQFARRFLNPSWNLYEAMPSHARGFRVRVLLEENRAEVLDWEKI